MKLPILVAATIGIVCGASVAHASPPSAANSSLQSHGIVLVGAASGVPDAVGAWTVTVRNAINNPIAGSDVVIDFTNCSDLVVSCDQLSAVTGQSASGRRVSGVTNASGQFMFFVQGSSNVAALPAGNVTAPGTDAGTPCASIYAAGVLLGQLIVSAEDLNGRGSPTNAVDGSDVAIAAAEAVRVALGAPARARDDYDRNGRVNGADVAILAKRVVAGGSQNTGSACP